MLSCADAVLCICCLVHMHDLTLKRQLQLSACWLVLMHKQNDYSPMYSQDIPLLVMLQHGACIRYLQVCQCTHATLRHSTCK